MALIKCPDCGKEVSSSAPKCPHCGKPMASSSGKEVQTQRKGGKFEGIGFLLIIVLIVGGIFTCFFSGALGGILIVIGLIVFLIERVRREMAMYVCKMCGFVGRPKVKRRGSILLEIFLWMCFIVPGVLYSLWRTFCARYKVCRKCGNATLIPVNTPVGRKLVEEQKLSMKPE